MSSASKNSKKGITPVDMWITNGPRVNEGSFARYLPDYSDSGTCLPLPP